MKKDSLFVGGFFILARVRAYYGDKIRLFNGLQVNLPPIRGQKNVPIYRDGL